MPEAACCGLSVHYDDRGTGAPLLLVHGFTATGKQMAPFVSRFEPRRRVIVPDLPGHGQSAAPVERFSHREAASMLHQLLCSLQVERVQAIGFSSGALTLLHLATLWPDSVERMVLWGAAPYLPRECREIMASIEPRTITAKELPWLADQPGGRIQEEWVLGQFKGLRDRYGDVNLTPPLLGTIAAETLIVHGDRDEYFPVELALMLHSAIRNSFLCVVPNESHFFTPAGVVGVVEQCDHFLSDGWAQSRA
jgi:pimeloyl-ACP methyl ester carboxylesterase